MNLNLMVFIQLIYWFTLFSLLIYLKVGAYVISLDEFKSIGTHLIPLYVNGSNIIFLDSFEVEHISKKIKKNHRKEKYHNKYL